MDELQQLPVPALNADLIRRKLFTMAAHYEPTWRPEVERLLPMLRQIPGWVEKAAWFIPSMRADRLPEQFQRLLSLCRTFSADQWQPQLIAFLAEIPDDKLISLAQWMAGWGPWLVAPAEE